MKTILIMMITFALTILPNIAYSEESTTMMNVSVVVNSSCKFSTDGINFGTYDPVDANKDNHLVVESKIEMKCVRGTTAEIGINSGLHQGQSGTTTRAMKSSNGNTYLAYEIYSDAGQQTVLNNQHPVIYNASSAATTNIQFYASIPAGQPVQDGSYTDIATVTVTY